MLVFSSKTVFSWERESEGDRKGNKEINEKLDFLNHVPNKRDAVKEYYVGYDSHGSYFKPVFMFYRANIYSSPLENGLLSSIFPPQRRSNIPLREICFPAP